MPPVLKHSSGPLLLNTGLKTQSVLNQSSSLNRRCAEGLLPNKADVDLMVIVQHEHATVAEIRDGEAGLYVELLYSQLRHGMRHGPPTPVPKNASHSAGSAAWAHVLSETRHKVHIAAHEKNGAAEAAEEGAQGQRAAAAPAVIIVSHSMALTNDEVPLRLLYNFPVLDPVSLFPPIFPDQTDLLDPLMPPTMSWWIECGVAGDGGEGQVPPRQLWGDVCCGACPPPAPLAPLPRLPRHPRLPRLASFR